MFVIGITGGIGCGKSLAANVCKDKGLPIIDADEISKQLTSVQGKAIPEIVEVFGDNILSKDGSLNRNAMSKIVFKNKKSLDVLSSIVHKYVIEEIKQEVEKYSKQKIKAIALDVPIPVKDGFLNLCDQIWVIWADEQLRIQRLHLRGMDEIEAKRRMSCQMTKDEYEKIADIVIYNNGSKEEFVTKVEEILDKELLARGIRL